MTELSKWIEIDPQVNTEAEFLEIVHDFGNPLELLREAISNSIDAKATEVRISFDVVEVDGNKRLQILIADDGIGMTEEIIQKDFWGLGYSSSRERKDAIGEKGHGTKIYLRSEKVIVKTQSAEGAFLSECVRPMSDLTAKKMHNPRFMPIENFLPKSGTQVTIIGYNDNQRSEFIQDKVRDYILWFTKVGSVERQFGIDDFKDFTLYLKCIDVDKHEKISFGHPFPNENSNIDKLFDEHGSKAADLYVRRIVKKGLRLTRAPEVTYDVIISVEADEVKRSYNPMIRNKRMSDSGRYKVGDRYGIYLCKDYIPVKQKNEWITGFGSGSNAFVLLHAFVNCQSLRLTANRGDIANTDAQILDELRESVQKIISELDTELKNNGLYTLIDWQQEFKTLQEEKDEFARRIKEIKKRKYKDLDGEF